MQEEWGVYPKDERYLISDYGNVFSLCRSEGKELQKFHVEEYLKVEIAGKHKFIHELVLETFTRVKRPGELCRHLDGDPTNNELRNLVWGTPKENVEDSRRHGTFRKLKGEQCRQSKLNMIQVRLIRKLWSTGRWTQTQLSGKFGVSQSRISSIVNHQSYKEN